MMGMAARGRLTMLRSAVLLFLLLLSSPGLGQSVDLEETFAGTARLHGRAYAVGRDFLVAQGAELSSLIAARARSGDFRERRLARLLRVSIERPAEVAALRETLRTDPPEVIRAAKVPAALSPVVTDVLWEGFGSGGVDARWKACLVAIGPGGDADTARELLHLSAHGTPSGAYAELRDALAAIGEPAVPALSEALRAEHWWRPALGAAVLGRIGGERARAALEAEMPGRAAGRISLALAAIGDVRSLPVILRALTAPRVGPTEDGRDWGDYAVHRRSLLDFPKEAVATLLREEATAGGPLSRFIAEGCLHELAHPEENADLYARYSVLSDDPWHSERFEEPKPDAGRGRDLFFDPHQPGDDLAPLDPPLPLLVERAAVFGMTSDLEFLCRRAPAETTARVLALLLRRGPVLQEPGRWVVKLAEVAGTGAFPVYRELLADHGPWRWHPGAFAEGVLLAGDRSGLPLLDEIEAIAEEKAVGEAVALARAARTVLAGGADELAPLLADPNPAIRAAAARTLLKRGDLRGLPPLLSIAAALRGSRHERLAEIVAETGTKALPLLRRLAADADEPRVRLLAAALVVRTEDPELAAKVARELVPPPWRSAAPPPVGHWVTVGFGVADRLGKTAVPLLEAEIAFGDGRQRLWIAAGALARLGEERSIPRILEAAKEGGLGSAQLAYALREFGEKGIEAAKQVPPPDPERPAYSGRAARHRGAAEALADAEEPQGVEKILEGLAVPPPERSRERDVWERRIRGYLRLAARYEDSRLLDAGLAILEAHGDEYLHAALDLLARHTDARAQERLLRSLRFSGDSEHRDAVAALRKALPPGILVRLLLAILGEDPDEWMRAGAAWTLGEAAGAGLSEEKLGMERRAVVDALLEALTDRSKRVGDRAARSLVWVVWSGGREIRDRRVLGPLADRLAASVHPDWQVLRLFEKSRDPEAAEILLDAYSRAGRRQPAIARALADLGRREVIPDLVALRDLHSLAKLGNEGSAELLRFFREGETIRLRCGALELLRKNGRRLPFEEAEALFREMRESRLWHPALVAREGRRVWGVVSGIVEPARAMAWLDPRRAAPLVKAAILTSRFVWERRGLEDVLGKLMERDPAVRALPAAAAARTGPEDEAEVGLLRLLGLWAGAVVGRPDSGYSPEFSAEAGAAALAAGPDALAAAVELCYPPEDFASTEELRAAVRSLDDPAARDSAILRLAITFYRRSDLEAALAEVDGEARRIGREILSWRDRHDPVHVMYRRWFLGQIFRRILAGGPVEELREVALSKLPRLARIRERPVTFLYREPLAPLLAAVRMSPVEEERARLEWFLAHAEPEACLTGLWVALRPLTDGRELWRPLPEHRYSAEAMRAAVLETGHFLTGHGRRGPDHAKQALSFLLYTMKKERIFDGPGLLAREHPDEAVRKLAAAIARRR
jgi:hypothetical protein